MSELNKGMEAVSDGELGNVVGGMSRNLAAAYDVMNGMYGDGDDRRRRLEAAGYNYWDVQHLVNGLAYGYDRVAKDVIAGKYGVGQARINALSAAGYNAALVQDIVNGMMW